MLIEVWSLEHAGESARFVRSERETFEDANAFRIMAPFLRNITTL
jgi:hypothetical protein